MTTERDKVAAMGARFLREERDALLASLATANERIDALVARLAAAEAQLQSILDAPVLFAEKVPDGLLPLFKAVVAVASQRWLAEHPT